MIVRELYQDDVGRLTEFFERNNVGEVTRHFHPFPLSKTSATRIARYRGRDKYYIAIKDDLFVGFAMLRGWDEGFDVPSFGLLVDRGHQGKGIGRELSLKVLNEAQQVCQSVRLSVSAANVSAQKLYLSLGFRILKQKEDTEGQVFIMRKEFGNAQNCH